MSKATGLRPPVVIATLMRERGGTGVQSHARTFRDHLLATGRESALVTPFSGRAFARAPLFGVRRMLAASGTASVWWYRHWHARYLSQALRDLPTDAVIYAQCPVSADAALRARPDQPVVMAAHFNHSQADEWADKGLIPRDGALFATIREFEESVLPRLDGIVHVSEHTRAALEARIPGMTEVPGVMLPNFVGRSPSDGHAAVADLVSVGAVEPRKNQAYLIDVVAAAARRGRRLGLTVVGSGTSLRALRARAERAGVGDLVHFTGHLADPRPVVARHRLFVHAATEESFGIAVVEAMAEGVPVVVGAVGGLREVVRPGLDGLFWPLDDPAAGAALVCDLLDDPARLAALGSSARARVAASYATDVVAPRLVDFLDGRWAARAAAGSPRHRDEAAGTALTEPALP